MFCGIPEPANMTPHAEKTTNAISGKSIEANIIRITFNVTIFSARGVMFAGSGIRPTSPRPSKNPGSIVQVKRFPTASWASDP